MLEGWRGLWLDGSSSHVAQIRKNLDAFCRDGRLPVIYTHPSWANGEKYGRRGLRLDRPVAPGSLLARCDLWLADYREDPQIPYAWADRGWRLWQYAANHTESDVAYGSTARTVDGVSHCDRNLFAGDEAGLYQFWKARGGSA